MLEKKASIYVLPQFASFSSLCFSIRHWWVGWSSAMVTYVWSVRVAVSSEPYTPVTVQIQLLNLEKKDASKSCACEHVGRKANKMTVQQPSTNIIKAYECNTVTRWKKKKKKDSCLKFAS